MREQTREKECHGRGDAADPTSAVPDFLKKKYGASGISPDDLGAADAQRSCQRGPASYSTYPIVLEGRFPAQLREAQQESYEHDGMQNGAPLTDPVDDQELGVDQVEDE